jgi:hypothetical protein
MSLKKYLLCIVVYLVAAQLPAATYSWNTWVAGALSYSTTNLTATVTNTNFDTRGPQDPNGGTNNGYKSPKYVSNATINTYQGGFTNDYGLQGLVLGLDWPNLTSSTTVTITFNTAVAGPVSFSIYDINTGSWGGNDPVWIDKITIAGTNCSGASVYPAITGCNNAISGANNNVITGNLGCTNSTNTITFNSPTVKTITITYASGGPLASGYGSDPDPEYIIISDITASNLQLAAIANNAGITCTSPSVVLNGSSSVNNATYSWTGPNSNNPAGTAPTAASTMVSSTGDYVLAVTDPLSGCVFTDTITVIANTAPPGASIATPGILGCSNSSVTLQASSSTGGVSYSWSGGGTGSTKTVTLAGVYTVTVTGPGNGCTSTASVTVDSITNPLVFNVITTPATCGNVNGTATVNVTSGTAIGYIWSNAQSGQSISNLGVGNYVVTVTEISNCTGTALFSISSSGNLSVSAFAVNATCGNSNGSATVTVTAGTATGYSWSSGATTATASGLVAGSYTVTVAGSGGCSATASATVTSSGGITITASATDAGCGNNNGTASVTVTSGTASNYSWNTGDNTTSISNLAGGTYSVTVTDASGCSATATASVALSGGITITASSVNTTCGNNNGSASVSVTSGTATGYSWSNQETTASVSNLSPGTYTVTVTGSGGCTATASVTVGSGGNTPVTVTSDKTIMCSGDTAHICAPSGFVSYLWNTGATTECIDAKNAGNYYITVTDAGGCTATSNHLAINVRPQPPVSISVNGDTLLSYNAVTYQWYLNNNQIPGANMPVWIATQSGFYTVLVSDTNGCIALSLPVEVTVTGLLEISMSEVRVYPNPSQSGFWNLEFVADFVGGVITIYDNTGRLIYTDRLQGLNKEIRLNVARGVYLLQIASPGKNRSFKLVKL